MKVSELIADLNAGIAAGVPAMIWGPPGIGKSDTVHQVSKTLERVLTDLRTALLDPVDLRGVPHVVPINGHSITRWAVPDFLPTKGPGILFLDELPNSVQMVQSALLQLVLDRRLGDYKLPDDVAIIAAGNRVEDRAGSGRLISSLNARFMHLDLEVDTEEWVAWAFGADIATEVIAFIGFRPNLLSGFDPQQRVSPTPRGWERVSNIMPHLSKGTEYGAFVGIVGEGAATEFEGFRQVYMKLPDPHVILMDPNNAEVPDISETATLCALTTSLASMASEKTADALLTYAGRLPAEYSMKMVLDGLRVDKPGLSKNRAFQAWATDHREIFAV